ncbi:MAG TPA: MFS transporter [Acidiferrobacterales bacterium]|nr:MFS transporter [Acidiferrobacterales bacterium]
MSSASPIPFFVGCYTWNFAFGVSMMVVPLYAHQLNMSGFAIGSLIGIPVVIQILFSLAGGAFTDRLGGRIMMLFSFTAMSCAGLVFCFAHSFPPLLLGQLLLVISRATYWPSSQTIASNLPQGRVQLGRLNASSNIGQISGTIIAGFLLAQFGFQIAFLALTFMGIISFLLGARSPLGAPSGDHRPVRFLSNFIHLLRGRTVYFAILCAYVSALPISLGQSFYPILLTEFGLASQTTGSLLALRALGAVTAGLLVARYIKSTSRRALPLISMIGIAAAIGFMPLFNNVIVVGLFLLGVGVSSGVMTLYYQILVSDISTSSNRGSALALGGLGWSLSHLTTPLFMGILADTFGLTNAFYIWGTLTLMLAVGFIPMQRWAISPLVVGRVDAPT